jgi:RNA polymerase sigma factor (sigma-70 family)
LKGVAAIDQQDTAKYLPIIKKFTRRYRYIIEDAEQEAWLAYAEAARTYDPAKNCAFTTFLFWKLRWHFKQLTRDYRRRQQLQSGLREQRLLAQQNIPAATPELDIDNLPPRTREAVRHILDGKTLTQTARIMRITPQAVRNLLNRARKLMLLEK